jgi:putative salt-induced outer membrane protein YdiY
MSDKATGKEKYTYIFSVFYKIIYFINLTFASCLMPFASEGQIVNIENQRLKGNVDGWSGNFDLSFSIIQNTKSIYQFGNRNKLNYKQDRHNYMLLTDVLVVKSANESFANSGFEHLRYTYDVKKFPFLYLEAFQQGQYNRVQLLAMRFLTGGGARFKVLDQDSSAMSIGTFMMHEYEEQLDNITISLMRYSLFLTFDFQINKNFGFNCITYYQPAVFNAFDFRVNTEASIRMKITQKLQFKISYNLIYDSEPPATVPNTNYILSNSFSYHL